jgi:SAM-dependent methyltransferase
MRLADLDRDHSAVIPLGTDRVSEFLYARTAEVTFAALGTRPGARVLDCAGGLGNDASALADRGLRVTLAEPSRTLTELSLLVALERGLPRRDPRVQRVRAFADRLPFPDSTFDASYCKGSLDHFDDPLAAIAELARVTRRRGRVVLAVANMDSAASRVLRLHQRIRAPPDPARRHQHVPPDHFTRYDPPLLLEHARASLEIESVQGVSLLWGVRSFARAAGRLPRAGADRLLRALDRVARRVHPLADLIVVAGRPRRTGDAGSRTPRASAP